MSNDLIPPDKPVEFEARNLRRRFRQSTKYGPMYFVEIEVDKELWNALEVVPPTSLVKGYLWYTDGDNEQAPKKVREPKGDHGHFWQRMCAVGALHNLDLRDVLRVPEGDDKATKAALYKTFKVESLAQIEPKRFADWAQAHSLTHLALMASDVLLKLQRANQ